MQLINTITKVSPNNNENVVEFTETVKMPYILDHELILVDTKSESTKKKEPVFRTIRCFKSFYNLLYPDIYAHVSWKS